MTIQEFFLIVMVIIFSVPYLIWRLGKTDYWAPLVVVQICIGILLGPGVSGTIFPEYTGTSNAQWYCLVVDHDFCMDSWDRTRLKKSLAK